MNKLPETMRIVAIGRLQVALALAALLAPLAGAAEPRVMLGYYTTFGELQVKDIPWPQLTHVCHAFLSANREGELQTSEKVPDRTLTAAAHKQQVQVLLSLGGGESALAFERVTSSPEALDQYVQQVLELMSENGYDGLDIDWEFPRTEAAGTRFTGLVKTFRDQLNQLARSQGRRQPYLLTAAVSSSQFFGKFIDTDQVAPQLDWLNVMTYDYSGPWDRVLGHNAPLLASRDDPARSWRSVSNSMAYWQNERGVPADKLVMGLPFYGRLFPLAEKYAPLDRRLRDKHKTLTYAAIRPLLDDGWQAEWDNELQVPWMISPDDEPKLLAYDDRNSIYRKTAWARQQSFRGVFFWALNQDHMPDGRHWLVEASYKAWPTRTQ